MSSNNPFSPNVSRATQGRRVPLARRQQQHGHYQQQLCQTPVSRSQSSQPVSCAAPPSQPSVYTTASMQPQFVVPSDIVFSSQQRGFYTLRPGALETSHISPQHWQARAFQQGPGSNINPAVGGSHISPVSAQRFPNGPTIMYGGANPFSPAQYFPSSFFNAPPFMPSYATDRNWTGEEFAGRDNAPGPDLSPNTPFIPRRPTSDIPPIDWEQGLALGSGVYPYPREFQNGGRRTVRSSAEDRLDVGSNSAGTLTTNGVPSGNTTGGPDKEVIDKYGTRIPEHIRCLQKFNYRDCSDLLTDGQLAGFGDCPDCGKQRTLIGLCHDCNNSERRAEDIGELDLEDFQW